MAGDIAVAGATGALGGAICALLGARARPLRRPGVDLTRPETLAPALEGARSVVSTATCFPREDAIDRVDRDGTIALVDAAEAAGAERFVFVSFRPVALDFPLQRAKRAVEERLARSPLETVVLRPGKFMDIWFSPLVGFDAAARTATIFGDGTRPLTWIARDDVAQIAARAAVEGAPEALELGGPEALSQREAVAVFEDVLGARFTLTELPADELERQRREAPTALEESLAALMLESHLGAVTDPPHGWTTLRELAARITAT